MTGSEQLAYLAGIIDGEGSISAAVYGTGDLLSNLCVTVTNTYEPVLQLCKATFGVGTVHADYGKRPAGRRPIWGWVVYGTSCEAVLVPVLPFLLIKRKQAEYALAIVEEMKRNGGRHRTTAERLVRLELGRRLNALNH